MGKWLEVYIISWLVFQLLTTKDFTISWIIYGFPTAVVSLKLQWLCLGTPAPCFAQALNRGNVLFTTLGKNLARALGSFSSWSFKSIQTHHWEHASVKWDIHSQKYRNTMAVGIYCKIICIQLLDVVNELTDNLCTPTLALGRCQLVWVLSSQSQLHSEQWGQAHEGQWWDRRQPGQHPVRGGVKDLDLGL